MTAKIKLNSASGGGSVSLQAPSSSSNNRVFTIPDEADATLLTSNTSTGKILQVISVSDSVRESVGTVSMSSANTYYDTPFAVTITPSATSSKILLMGHVMGEFNNDDYKNMWRINRAVSGGSTTAIQAASAGSRPLGISVVTSAFYSSNADSTPTVVNFSGLLDSPNTTSAITYTFQVNATQGASKTFFYNQTVNNSDGIDYERGLSWITAQEISA